jgi:hypothetical protein
VDLLLLLLLLSLQRRDDGGVTRRKRMRRKKPEGPVLESPLAQRRRPSRTGANAVTILL